MGQIIVSLMHEDEFYNDRIVCIEPNDMSLSKEEQETLLTDLKTWCEKRQAKTRLFYYPLLHRYRLYARISHEREPLRRILRWCSRPQRTGTLQVAVQPFRHLSDVPDPAQGIALPRSVQPPRD